MCLGLSRALLPVVKTTRSTLTLNPLMPVITGLPNTNVQTA